MTIKRQQKTIKETLGEEASKEFMQIHKDFLKNLDKNLDEIDRKKLEEKQKNKTKGIRFKSETKANSKGSLFLCFIFPEEDAKSEGEQKRFVF